MTQAAPHRSEPSPSRPRIHPTVAVTLLETIRSQDLPTEVLEDEDPAVTMPRRLGLSEAVEQQIRRYREDARRRRRLPDRELASLIRLAIRRPDSEDIFFRVGETLAGPEPLRGRRLLPAAVGYLLARRRVRRTLRTFFGRSVGGFGSGRFTFEGRSLLFIQNDPGGDACALVTGLCEASVRRYVSSAPSVAHFACQARRDELCRWRVVDEGDAE